jgi:chaperonin GroEL (HSP60 family)
LCICFISPHQKKILYFFREYDITKERIEKILAAGANVILTTGGIDDLCLKYFVEAGAMAVRRCKKVDLKRIAKATGGGCSVKFGCYTSTVFEKYGFNYKKILLSHTLLERVTVSEKLSEYLNKFLLSKLSLSHLTGQLVMTLANLEGEETFDASMLGNAEEVVQDRVCDDELILVKG